jgi:hypothetical protein
MNKLSSDWWHSNWPGQDPIDMGLYYILKAGGYSVVLGSMPKYFLYFLPDSLRGQLRNEIPE